MSVKAFLATEQRIPGLGNGVLQDILFHARIHPKRKMNTLSLQETHSLYEAVKSTLSEMAAKGGRDTEKDLFGCPGGYQSFLSKNTVGTPCPVCGTIIKKEAYLGGSIYYCEGCQPLI
jgi:formamidopyrimidine-DNA glycosylase